MIDWPAAALSSSPSKVTMAATLLVRADGSYLYSFTSVVDDIAFATEP